MVQITPGDFNKRVVFGTSGGDACAIALKASLTYTKRPATASYTYSYHGTTALDIAVGGSFSEALGSSVSFRHVVFQEYLDVYRCRCKIEDPELCGEYYLSEHEDVLRRLEASENIASDSDRQAYTWR